MTRIPRGYAIEMRDRITQAKQAVILLQARGIACVERGGMVCVTAHDALEIVRHLQKEES